MRGILRFDGAAEPTNPGPIGAGFVLELGEGTTVERGESFAYEATENVAEYQALLLGLRAAAEAGVTDLVVESESELVIHQMRGDYEVRSAHLRPLLEEARALAERFDAFELAWIPRDANDAADGLAKEAAWASGEGELEPWDAARGRLAKPGADGE